MHKIEEIDGNALDALIERLNEAKKYELTLSAEDIELLLSALATLATLQDRLTSNDVTIHKLRKLLGMVSSSEKLSALLKQPAKSKPKRKKPAKPAARVKPEVVHHHHETLSKGDRCHCCEKGTLSKYEPATLLRITGNSPYQATQHISERLRCNACGQYFTATLPKAVLADGDSNQKYGYSARSIMAIGKYFMGSPFFRQESLQAVLGMPVSASTVFDQCEKVADSLHPIYKALLKIAANAIHFHLDDTTHHILDQKEITKPRRHSNTTQQRTGTYASGLIATTHESHEIVLFQTNIGHAGEWIDEVLQKRDPGQAPPLLMSDALSSNKPSQVEVIQALCNSHARRQFVDLLAHFPDEVDDVLAQYKLIWNHDDHTKKAQMSPSERLDYHHEHSLPVMESIRQWGQNQLDQELTEENSGLGKAIRYFLRHYDGLTRFCTIAGAKIDNNIMEAQLKLIVRGRKNFSFYKTLAGAAISDIITSVIATCVQNEANPFDYLNAIQRHQERVKEDPIAWLPWNYQRNS